MFRVEDGWEGIFEPRAGAVFPEACIDAHLKLAQSAGAKLNFDCPVLDWTAEGSAVGVKTRSGEISAGRLVVCAGAWVTRLAADLALPVEIERMTLFFFRPLRNAGMFTSGRCPNNTWVCENGVSFYCQPDFGRGFKAALHCGRVGVNPDTLDRNTSPGDEARIRPLVERFIPDAAGPVVESHVCMYTNLPDNKMDCGLPSRI